MDRLSEAIRDDTAGMSQRSEPRMELRGLRIANAESHNRGNHDKFKGNMKAIRDEVRVIQRILSHTHEELDTDEADEDKGSVTEDREFFQDADAPASEDTESEDPDEDARADDVDVVFFRDMFCPIDETDRRDHVV
jgi:hypothetical protein